MKLKVIFSILMISLLSLTAVAEEYRRTIFLEWEPIEGAATYDVEITRVLENKQNLKPKVFASGKAEWTGKLDLGKYMLKVRGRDRRKAPGEWSESQDFFVGLDTPKLITPKAQEKVLTRSEDTEKVRFKWEPVGGADEYLFELNSEDGKVSESKRTSDTDISMKLPVAAKYSWKVTAENKKGFKSDTIAIEQFTHWGAKIEKPKLNELQSAYVRELEWQRPNYAENFDYALTRYNDKTKKWELKDRKSNIANSKIPFPEKFQGGQYKMTIRANGKLRQSSDITEFKFPVANGSRTPAAEETATVRQSIDRTTGWFVIASYLLTSINYEGTDSDNGATTSLDGAMGGTGRLGAGYMSDKSNWGFLGIVDYSGFSIGNEIKNYGSMEGNAIYRTDIGDRSEIRQQIGGFYKELPVFLSNGGSTTSQAVGNLVVAMGPHYAIEYWQAISAKFGFQANVHAYLNAIALKTPNGREMTPDMSLQFGFLGSYRLSRKMTGLAGYAYRKDSITYKANSGVANPSSVTGNYLNLFLEWAL
jgi:hypothetical protein